ncbi:serine hydroxymethyltransferase [Ferrimicrobium acidiphilum]|uniref:Serine hydroxymethyltransferase n=1 Tax=Ferrimicrobium acidiphilum DSM 19497 TaxID=1121877 RepID=A0A0D8FYN4_9ACTN|nr:serine hydroxymethyltransferase [Ferrimicrobium acidiphilum]KJE77577.1 serine hydroxymethyltransferase [Ferrimicrobium acidiphilum DSM 19497]MCL5053669.1 serine hydroxymethyltransferase [Gammaproteobacteria bacterium]
MSSPELLQRQDPEVARLIEEEQERQRTTLQLIASENFASRAVMEATGSVLTNKYAEGYPSRRYYGGNQIIDQVETLAIERCKQLFGAPYANVQPHAGANANAGAYLALLEPRDRVLAMRLDQGGHLTHGSPVNFSGQIYDFISYGVRESDPNREWLDLDQMHQLALEQRPKLIVIGATAYSRIIEVDPVREIADEVGALVLFDAAHVAGLIAAGVYPNPLFTRSGGRGADVVTFTTHKTLRGPRGAAIIAHEDLGKSLDKAIFPGLQGGPLEHAIAAKAVAFGEAMDPDFRQYGQRVVDNARVLADSLSAEGFRIVSGGTDVHLMLVDLRDFDAELDGRTAQVRLDRSGITCNRNQIPFDPRSPFVTSGLRLGTAAMTTAGMSTDQMKTVASLISRVLRTDDDQTCQEVRREVADLCRSFPPPSER